MRDRAALSCLVLWVFLAPLLLGSVDELNVGADTAFARFLSAGGAYAVFRVLGALSAAWWAGPLLFSRGRGAAGPGEAGRRLLLLLGLLGLLAVVQEIALPRGIHALLAPAHASDLAVLLPEGGAAPVSTDAGLTSEAVGYGLLLLLAGVSVLFAARGPVRAWTLLFGLTAAAALGSAYGILETGWLGDRVLGFPKPSGGAGVTGTFFYRGSFAALAAAALGVAGAGLAAALRSRRGLLAAGAATAVVLLAAGLLLSRSRAGLAAGGIALAAGLVLRLRSRKVLLGTGLLVFLAVAGAGLSLGALRRRFALMTGPAGRGFLDIRVPAWGSTLRLFAGRPVLGCGLGTYRRAIHLTQSTRNPDELYHAHSDVLELLAEGGVVGFLPGVLLAVLGLLGAFRLARGTGAGGAREPPGDPGEGREPREGCRDVGAACTAGLLGLLVMAAVDFPLHVPALGLVFTVLLFLPSACPLPPLPRARPPGPAGARFSRIPAAVLLLALLLPTGRDHVRSRALLAQGLAAPAGAPRYLTEGEIRAARGLAALERGETARARAELRVARVLQPFEGATHYHLAALAFRETGDFGKARPELLAAYRAARGRAPLLFRIGVMAYRAGFPLAADAFREAGELEPRFFPAALRGVRPELVPRIVPDRAFAYSILGRWYLARRERGKALEAFRGAVERGARGDPVRRLAALYRELGREAEGRRWFASRSLPWPD